MQIHLTKHAEKRMKERLNIKSKSEKQRMAELAFERGEFVDIEEREEYGTTTKRIILEYQDRLFIFSKDASLITVLSGERKHYESKQGLLGLIAAKEIRTAIAYA